MEEGKGGKVEEGSNLRNVVEKIQMDWWRPVICLIGFWSFQICMDLGFGMLISRPLIGICLTPIEWWIAALFWWETMYPAELSK